MTDQDLDGSHIEGLGINLFQSQWESLSKIPGFLGFMNTPITIKQGNTRRQPDCDLLLYSLGVSSTSYF